MRKKNNEHKNVYIFGNENVGFHGHTYYKEYAKAISKTRKSLKMVKIKNDEYCKSNLSVNTEFITLDGESFLTADEEEYFIESFTQFQRDVIRDIDIFFNNIGYFELNDEEKYAIRNLILYLKDYKDFILDGKYDEGKYEDESDMFDKIFNTTAAAKWFIKYVLEV